MDLLLLLANFLGILPLFAICFSSRQDKIMDEAKMFIVKDYDVL